MPDGISAATPQSLDQIASLCDELQGSLGPFGFQWLAACAVYPGLRFPLTVHLGRRLAEALDRGPPDENEHLALCRLPWFRSGWMPEELRLALLPRLDPGLRPLVRQAIEELLFAALDDDKRDPDAAAPLDFARPPKGWRGMLRAWFDAAPPGAPARDAIFAHYMMGRVPKPFDLRLNRALSRLLGARLAGWLDRRTLLWLAATVFAGVAIWSLADQAVIGMEPVRVPIRIGSFSGTHELYDRSGRKIGTTPYESTTAYGSSVWIECRRNGQPTGPPLEFQAGLRNFFNCPK